jgi:hypothetical protein
MWTLENRQTPLTLKKLTKGQRDQVQHILDHEGRGTIAEAKQDDEFTLESVDVLADGKQRFQLYLWPSGSAFMFENGTPKRVASAAQHRFVLDGDDDAALRKSLGAAFARARKKLGIAEILDFDGPRAKAPKETKKAASAFSLLSERLAGIKPWKLDDAEGNEGKLRNCISDYFGGWKPYPKLRLADLTADQRAVLEHAVKVCVRKGQFSEIGGHCGLYDEVEQLARFLGLAKQGASDVMVGIGKTQVPLVLAVSDVASGHLDAEVVLDAFRKLPPAACLAGWIEMAHGKAYDLLDARVLKMNDRDRSRTPDKVKYNTRVFGWLADASVALGANGRAAAEQLATSLVGRKPLERGVAVERQSSAFRRAPTFVALLALVRHGGKKAKLEARYTSLVPRLDDSFWSLDPIFADPVLKEIRNAL